MSLAHPEPTNERTQHLLIVTNVIGACTSRHPPTDKEIEGKGLIVLVKSSETPDVEVVKEALSHYRDFINKWHNLQKQATQEDSNVSKAADQP